MHSRLENQTTDATPTKSTFFESVSAKMESFINYIKSDGADDQQITRRDMFGILAGAGIGLSGCAVTGINTITDDDLYKFMQRHNIQLPGVQRDRTWVAIGTGESYDEAATKARAELAERGYTESGTPTVEPLGQKKWIVMIKGVKKDVKLSSDVDKKSVEEEKPTQDENLFIAEDGVQKGLVEIVQKYRGLRWIGKLSGNGNRDALIYIPPGSDPDKPFEIIYHFHGTHSHLTNEGSVGANRLGQVFNITHDLNKKPDRNIVVVYPLSAGRRGKSGGHADRNGYDDYWMKKGNSTNDDMAQMHAETLNTVQSKFGINIKIDSITIKGHSAGGRALQRISESGFKVDRVDFLDASYGSWAQDCHKAVIRNNPNTQINIFVMPNDKTPTSTDMCSKSLKGKRGINIIKTRIPHGKMIKAFFGWMRN